MSGTLAGAAYGFVLLGRNYGRWAGPADWALARRMLREAAPFYLAGAFTLVYARADVLLLKPLSFDAEVGAYRAAGQLVEVVKQLPVLLMTATFPQLARGYQDSRAALVRTERAITGMLAGRRVPARRNAGARRRSDHHAAVRAGISARAVPALRTLAPAVPLLFVNCGVLHFFIARDRGTLNLAFAAVMVVVNAGMNLALDRRLGAVGAATATVVTEAMLLRLLPLRAPRPPPRGRARPAARPPADRTRPDRPNPARTRPARPPRPPRPSPQPRSRARPTSRPDRTPLPLARFFRREGSPVMS